MENKKKRHPNIQEAFKRFEKRKERAFKRAFKCIQERVSQANFSTSFKSSFKAFKKPSIKAHQLLKHLFLFSSILRKSMKGFFF